MTGRAQSPARLLFSRRPWAAGAYLGSYLVVGPVFFAVALAWVVTSTALCVTVLGVPLLVTAALLLRGCAQVERWRARLVRPPATAGPVVGRYLKPTDAGLFGQVKTRWRDGQTWRDLAYLLGLFVPLLVLDAVVFSGWLTLLSGVTVPAWYWSIPTTFDNGQTAHGLSWGYFPNGPHGSGGHGFWIGSPVAAILAAVVSLVLFVLFSYVTVAAAGLHGRLAAGLLGPRVDPLGAAKEVLASPGPLQRAAPVGIAAPRVESDAGADEATS
jgi:hypothetical protein